MTVVYRITSPSGKSYIGVAKHGALARFKKHCFDAKSGRNTALAAAIRKYGPSAMDVQTLVESTSAYCFDLEIKAIQAYGTLHPNGYNLTTGGEGVHEMAEASKEKHAASMKCPERVAKIAKASKEFHSRPDVIKKKSEAMKARWKNKEWRRHMKGIAKAKKAAKIQESAQPVVQKVKKSCDFCYATYECDAKVSSYKRYCCKGCAQSASYAAVKTKRAERY